MDLEMLSRVFSSLVNAFHSLWLVDDSAAVSLRYVLTT